jgi:hypothetical protein
MLISYLLTYSSSKISVLWFVLLIWSPWIPAVSIVDRFSFTLFFPVITILQRNQKPLGLVTKKNILQVFLRHIMVA